MCKIAEDMQWPVLSEDQGDFQHLILSIIKSDTCIMLCWISSKELTDWHFTYSVNMMTPHAQLKQKKTLFRRESQQSFQSEGHIILLKMKAEQI